MSDPVVTVFGGTGFLGRHIVQRLARLGATIRVATRRPDRALFLKPLGGVGQIVPVPVHYGKDDSIARALQGSDWVINLVGILTEQPGREFTAIHGELPGRIGRIAVATGVARFVQISAIGAAANSGAAYLRSKAAGEAAARATFPGVTIMRPSVVFGPEDGFFNALGALSRLSPVIPLFFCGWPRLAFDGIFPALRFPGAGASLMQPVYVGNVADAVIVALRDPKSAGRVFELGGPTVYRFREAVELALSVVRRRRYLVPVPFFALEAAAFFAQAIPFSPLRPDLVRMMKLDNIVSSGAAGLADLGITPTTAELILPTYLYAYRAGRAES
ncbi:MAG: complex I NDUFA9 subunit family protein [Alphaproteobacteria bacterium]|nr:complex I NDUFA9 subunit family protein [Alphaproteobacteria bacterium]